MFIDHRHHSFLLAHSRATEAHCARDGANEVLFWLVVL